MPATIHAPDRPRADDGDVRNVACAPGIAPEHDGGEPGRPEPSRQSLRGLDWFIFFLADVQTGFGVGAAALVASAGGGA